MTERINWSFAAAVTGGPTVSEGGAIDADAYIKLSVMVPTGANQAVEVLPDPGGALQLLIIVPAKPDSKLTYKVDGEDIPLDGPVVMIGTGAVSLLASTVGTLTFTNGTGDDMEISILAARDATPTP